MIKSIFLFLCLGTTINIFGQPFSDSIFITNGNISFPIEITSIEKRDIYFRTKTGNIGSVSRDKVKSYIWKADPEIPFPRLDGGEIGWVETGHVPGVSASDLYFSAKIWFVENFKNAGAVIQLDEENRGIIIGKGNFKIYTKGSLGTIFENRVDFTLKVEVKDQKFRIELSGIGYHDTNLIGQVNSLESIFKRDPPVKATFKELKTETLRQVNSILYELGNAIRNDSSKRDDW